MLRPCVGKRTYLFCAAKCALANGRPHGGADNARVGTSRDRLLSLSGCGDAVAVRSAVNDLCAEFGKVTRLDVVTMSEAEHRRALCFLRLESAAQEGQMMTSLGAARFGEDLLVIVELS